MATADLASPSPTAVPPLAEQWRSLTRLATLVALLTSPAAFVWFHSHEGLRLRYALLLTVIEVAAFRGLVDIAFRRFIASPSLFGEEREELRHEDVVMRRRRRPFPGGRGPGKPIFAKPTATGFTPPFVPFPGPGFARTSSGLTPSFVGYPPRRPRRLGRKWAASASSSSTRSTRSACGVT